MVSKYSPLRNAHCDRTRQHEMGDVALCKTNTGTEYLQYSERVTKTRTGVNPRNTRDVTQQSWSNLENSDRCHVTAYNKNKELRPVKCSSDNDSFYISSNTAVDNTSTKWFKSKPVGINKISGFLKIMITNAGTFHWLHVILTSFSLYLN